MRADKKYPRQIYTDFWDWLQWHPFWFINVLFAYMYYFVTTEEV
ncbi:MAG: hypothetical protein R2932_13710 [Caldilineaceae bacterium]